MKITNSFTEPQQVNHRLFLRLGQDEVPKPSVTSCPQTALCQQM